MEYSCYRDQVCVITGAGGEIGGGTARQLAAWGAKLALIDIHEERLNSILADCKAAGLKDSKIYSVVGDVMKQDVVTDFINGTVAKFGDKVHLLLNVVGTKRIMGIETCTLEDLSYVLDGNLKTTFMMTKGCLPYLINAKGNIINMSSFSGSRPMWEILPYCMAKAGLDIMTRCLSLELAKKGVRVNAIAPAALRSRFNMRFGDIFTSEDQLKGYYEMAAKSLPLRRVGTCEENVVPLIMFLSSDKATFINGSVIVLDGGYSNTCNVPK